MPWSDINPVKSWNDLVNATKVDQEATTSTFKSVTSSKQQFHPSAAKGWVIFNGTGTIVILDSYNVTSLVDNNTGDYTVNWNDDFSSNNYSVGGIVAGMMMDTSSGYFLVGSARIRTYIPQTGILTDSAVICVIAFGDR